ncbi:MAG: peptidylprolyl isomerase [Magnetovibrio sp.]|nr:peptidylprolyl isomerase [Magnetovibrio sp.]
MSLKRITRMGALGGVLVLGISGGLGILDVQAAETDPVVATVNDQFVRLSDIENARNSLSPKLQGAPLRDIYPMLLESLINSRLSADKARELGYHESPEYLHRMKRISDQILERILLARQIGQQLTDEMIMQRYKQVAERAKTEFEVRARHILVKTQDEALALIIELEADADFAELAKEHSTGPSNVRGGDLGWFGPGKMVKEFYLAAMALKVGDFTKTPVQSKYGWHVILVEERRPFPVPSYLDAREILAQELLAELGRDLISQLRDAAKIEKKSFEEVVKALQE